MVRFPIRRYSRYRAVAGWYDGDLQPSKPGGDKRWYFRSKLEVECAKHLATLVQSDNVSLWKYGKDMENGHWDFNERAQKPYRANSQYTVDFEVKTIGGKFWWVEVKGAMQGISKIRRALKHFPERPLFVYTAARGMEPAADYLRRLKIKREYKRHELPALVAAVRAKRKEASK